MDGAFIVFEGIDGAGTTTQADRYAQHLRANKRLVHVTREPSNGPIGSMLRLILTHRLAMPSVNQAATMALLFAADRLDHLEAEIAPLLRDGYVVISDRYDLSSIAYQTATVGEAATPARLSILPGESPLPDPGIPFVDWVRSLNGFARRPDATVVLNVSADVAGARRRIRGGVQDLYEDPELQARLATAYAGAAKLMPRDLVVSIDGDRDVDSVMHAVIAELDPILRVGQRSSKY